MFGQRIDDGPDISRIEIPLIQRDYAQGRRHRRVDEIRSAFLDVLHEALTGGEPVGLDFVYGEMDDGTFAPLDGQQRLTTLFLLHWYLAFRGGRLGDPQPWTQFTYATRPSARMFCERIVRHPPPADLTGRPSAWITDQSWFLHAWPADPTISAMLVMLDAIADRFQHEDTDLAWERLTDEADPSVRFDLLPIGEMDSAEELYIRMNSRGKPLTEFEVFKAHLGRTIAHTGRVEELGGKIDGSWTDLLWRYRGDNNIVDDEFMKYFDFVLEICEWREHRIRDEDEPIRPSRRAETLFGKDNVRHREHVDFFFDALDCWTDPELPNTQDTFEGFFTTMPSTAGIRLFGEDPKADLFLSCCERYGEYSGNARRFSLANTLLLYATLIYRIERTVPVEDAARRLRQLRNLNAASGAELNLPNMPKLIAEVAEFMRSGSLDALPTFNQNQVVDERIKRELLAEHREVEPHVQLLEDQPILRGTLAAFDLSLTTIGAHAAAFDAAFQREHWPLLTGALLASGEYQRDYPDSDYHQFGSPTPENRWLGRWRTVLADRGDRDILKRTRTVLASFLDAVAASPETEIDAQLQSIIDGFLRDREARAELDWRYYLVRYECMREGDSGIYYGADLALGYQMTMLRRTVQRSYYRDPYLYAIWCESGYREEVEDPWFYGYSTYERWLRLERSQTGMRSMPDGIALEAPRGKARRTRFESVCEQHPGVFEDEDGWLLAIEQNDDGIDREDRVQKAASLLNELIARGL